jgi:hypothetical protein
MAFCRCPRRETTTLCSWQCTILLRRAAQSSTLDTARREALLRRLEEACRGRGDR